MKKVAVIGSGIAGLSAAAVLAQKGLDVHVFEKNHKIGGRARVLQQYGFTFDMGPSWYWMPEVFESLFNRFNHTTADFYELKKLSPAFTIIFKNDVINIPNTFDEICEVFERYEYGAADKLRKFIADAKIKYEVAMGGFIMKPGISVFEFLNLRTLTGAFNLNLFSSFAKHAAKYFTHPYLLSILQFPVLFLGATPAKIPALYSLMNYAAFELGTWYPLGGFGNVINAFQTIATEQGVHIHINEPVSKLNINAQSISNISTKSGNIAVDAVIGAADYHHIDQQLIEPEFRQYNRSYWEERVMAPSCLVFYLGVNKKLRKLQHHNLFFDADYDSHAEEIYVKPDWPKDPLFYACCPSVTDPSVAPQGMENLFMLMPLAPGINDEEEKREEYFQRMLKRLENYAGENISDHIIQKKSYCVSDFINDYNAFKGNAYGLANTLNQTALLKPKIKSSKIDNLYYAGQLTVPGPGIPPSIISGQIAASLLLKKFKL
jgi:phytoene desaturase